MIPAVAKESDKLTRANVVGCAAASEINDLLTIILSGIDRLTEIVGDSEGQHILLEMRIAGQRAGLRDWSVLEWNKRLGFRPTPTALEILVRR